MILDCDWLAVLLAACALPCIAPFARRYLELDEHTGTLVVWNQRPPESLVYKIEDFCVQWKSVSQRSAHTLILRCESSLDFAHIAISIGAAAKSDVGPLRWLQFGQSISN